MGGRIGAEGVRIGFPLMKWSPHNKPIADQQVDVHMSTSTIMTVINIEDEDC